MSLLLLALACDDYDVDLKSTEPPAFDTGDPAPDTDGSDTDADGEACNGLDDDGDGLVDEGYPDTDGDGVADCLESACPALTLGEAGPAVVDTTCGAPEVADPWDIVADTLGVGLGAGGSITVGNLDDDNGDGDIDADDVPDIAYVSDEGRAVAVSGDGSGVLFSVANYMTGAGTVIADVNADGAPEVVVVRYDARLEALDGTGSRVWLSDTAGAWYPELTTGDLDADGLPEVIAHQYVFNGEDGTFAFALETNTLANYGSPVVGDVDQDGDEEILFNAVLYDADGAVLWDYTATDSYGAFGALLNADADDEAEILVVDGEIATLYEADGGMRSSFEIEAPYNYAGPPCVADFDGDGSPEVAIPQSFRMTVFELDGAELWSVDTRDVSGAAGCSGYDFDADGAFEVLYADEEDFYLFDGATGAIRYQDDRHESWTWYEYPIVADIDADGSAEILVPERVVEPGVRVYRHAEHGWPAAGPTWAVHDFAVTNVEPDGHVPSPREAAWLKYNLFRARPATDEASSAWPDLRVSITDVCVSDCEAGEVAVAAQVENVGGRDVDAGVSLALYALETGDERLVATVTLPAVPAGQALDGVQFDLTSADIGGAGFRAVVDDDGAGTGTVDECDEGNNADAWEDAYCP